MVKTLKQKSAFRRPQTGVTLIELLLVMLIIGLAASVAIINAPPAGQTAKREATRFAARLDAATDEAILTSEIIGIRIDADRYEFLRFRDDNWIDIGNRIFAPWELDRDITVSLITQDEDGQNLEALLKENDKVISGRGSTLFTSTDLTASASKPQKSPPEIQLRPIGVTTPFSVVFTGRKEEWAVRLINDGKIILSRFEEAG